MMRRILVAFALLVATAAASAHAQSGNMTFTGSGTPGHTVRCANSSCTVLTDAGSASGSTSAGQGSLTELGITNTGTPLCINDALTNAPGGFHQLCFGASALGGGLISFNAYGGAAEAPLNFNINESTYTFPFSGSGTGNVIGPNTSVIGHYAIWNNTTGTLLSDSAVAPSQSLTLGGTLLTLGTTTTSVTGLTLDNSPIGATTPSTGAFTTLGATGIISTSATTASTTPTTGAITDAGGLGVGGAVNLGPTPAISLAAFGSVELTVAAPSGDSTFLAFMYNNLAPSTNALPGAMNGYAYVNTQGNSGFGIYGLTELHATGGGVATNEMTSRNFCGSPDVNLPPAEGIGTTTCVTNGLQVTAGGTNNSSIGISVSQEGGSSEAFNTGIYLYSAGYAQYGIFIDAPASGGSQTGEVIKSDGGGLALQILNSGSSDSSTISTVGGYNHSGTPVWAVRQTGDAIFNSYSTLTATGVSCSAGTVTLVTEVVTNGIVTHC